MGFFLLRAVILSTWTLQVAGEVFDYVIAGGGTCGLLLANRLSADPTIRVAVIEPGDDVRSNDNVTTITRWLDNQGTAIDWQYQSVPQVNGGGRTLTYHAGKAVGGTSAINGMTYIRGDAAEIDAWEAMGNKGWNWQTLYPYYKQVEHWTRPTAAQVAAGATFNPDFHGESGLLDVGFLLELSNGSFHGIARDTWDTLGYPKMQDVNGGSVRGFDVWPMTVDREADVREDAGRAFFWFVADRPNLRLVKGTATRLLWQNVTSRSCNSIGASAKGIEYLDSNGVARELQVTKEVILSAGSLRTPPILERSGIGNPRILEELGIATVVELQGVGENLQDQPNLSLIYKGSINETGYAPYATFATAQDVFADNTSAIASMTRAKLQEWAERMASRSAGVDASALEKILQVQHNLIFEKNVTIAEVLTTASGDLLVSAFWALLPFSRGSVHLRSTSSDDADRPIIDPAFFEIDFDLSMQVAAGRLAQLYWTEAPANAYVIENMVPGISTLPQHASEEQWESFITEAFTPNHHPIGTAAMMSRSLGGVVDPELRVYGTSNVRVVDASILPLQISGHLTSTLYAVAERASEIIMKVK